jgi:hypothetical protein
VRQDGSEGDSKYMAVEVLQPGGKRPPADIFSLGMSAFELTWHVLLPGRGEAWSALRQGLLPEVDPALHRSTELQLLIRQVRRCGAAVLRVCPVLLLHLCAGVLVSGVVAAACLRPLLRLCGCDR